MDEQQLLIMLREAFKEEALERLTSLSSCLVQLERVEDDMAGSDPLEVAFREAHSLKGAARSVSLSDIESLCQTLESVLSQVKKGLCTLQTDDFDLLHNCVRVMEAFLDHFSTTQEADYRKQVAPLISQLQQLSEPCKQVAKAVEPQPDSEVQPAVEAAAVAAPDPADPSKATAPHVSSAVPPDPAERTSPSVATKDGTLRVSIHHLDSVMQKAESLITLKLTVSERHHESLSMAQAFELWHKDWNQVAPQLRRLQNRSDDLDCDDAQRAMDSLLGYIERTHNALQSLETQVSRQQQRLLQDKATTATLIDELLEEIKEIIMVPFANLSASFPRTVREVARTQGKEVDLLVEGDETEIDKRILEMLSSPLTHLIRNAIDHGIELPQTRLAAGKQAKARLQVSLARTQGGRVEVRICDDGAGIDLDRVRAQAVDRQLLTEQAAAELSDEEAAWLIFNSGLSTSSMITEISGRGLGMAIVKEKVEDLGGHLHVETRQGQGTCFKLHVPVSLAVFKGILIQTRGAELIVPTVMVERVLKVSRQSIRTVENREVICVDGENLSLVNLGGLLAITDRPITQTDQIHVVVVHDSEQRIGFVVDDVDGEYELLVKGLGEQLRHVRFFSGASVLGDGRVVPVLDARDLLSAPMEGAGKIRNDNTDQQMARRILAVDDSITSRMLIKNILEAAGYQVTTAIDGEDAFDKLTIGVFDLVVSDVEMPQLDGFGLTSRIRATESVQEIPVILVTSLESAEDKEKGIVAGANAYIVKRSFDQSNLLDTIQRLI
ncbi:hybrid sensor histidine kinase/response regulator [uncultured Desulfuromonas sp.]|uniref:hybrid sensor histidine kinase/response regulator n=1 Tax=uncultured Desulfuromonas sp. TaxID=181013 RepID=UPI002AAB0A1A|nr:hybrid sensor histidine kinase/response regulator [uncultured Desulfuromonas sp.]